MKKLLPVLTIFTLIATAQAAIADPILMFKTSKTYKGNLAEGYKNNAALEKIDAKCTADSQCTSTTGCVAVIAYSGYRQPAVPSEKQTAVNWVLLPNQEYVNSKGELIETTNENGTFDFNLDNTVSDSGKAWTGFYKDWTVGGLSCLKWIAGSSSDGSSTDGYYGYADSHSNTMISRKGDNCRTNKHSLYCVPK